MYKSKTVIIKIELRFFLSCSSKKKKLWYEFLEIEKKYSRSDKSRNTRLSRDHVELIITRIWIFFVDVVLVFESKLRDVQKKHFCEERTKKRRMLPVIFVICVRMLHLMSVTLNLMTLSTTEFHRCPIVDTNLVIIYTFQFTSST